MRIYLSLAVKTLVTAVLFTAVFSSFAKAASLCRWVLVAPNYEAGMRIENLVPASAAPPWAFLAMSSDDQLKAAAEALVSRGIEFEYRKGNPLIRGNSLVIATTGTSRINQVARAIARNYHVTLMYNPYQLKTTNAIAYYSNLFRIIEVSHKFVLNGQLDDAFFHEARHMALFKKEKQQKPNSFNGQNSKSEKNTWSWGEGNKLYGNYMNNQEVSTWMYQAKLLILSLEYFLHPDPISTPVLQAHLNDVEWQLRGTQKVLQDEGDHYDYALEVLENQPDLAKVKYSFEKGGIAIYVKGPTSKHDFVVPNEYVQKFVDSTIDVTDPKQMKVYLKTPVGQDVTELTAKLFLRDMRQSILAAQGLINTWTSGIEMLNARAANDTNEKYFRSRIRFLTDTARETSFRFNHENAPPLEDN